VLNCEQGLHVGLPEGNSEVGHESWCWTNCLSGFSKNKFIVANKTLAEEQVLKEAFQFAKDHKKSPFLDWFQMEVYILIHPFTRIN
jgi:2,3-bisphosphoglycerate-independent phosphoglycerate mutase